MLKMGAQNITGLYVGETKIKKAYLGEALIFSAGMYPSRLPEGYTEVQYIHTSGSTGGISTRINGYANTIAIELDVEVEQYNTNYKYLLRNSSGARCFASLISEKGIQCGVGSWYNNIYLNSSFIGKRIQFLIDSFNKKVVFGEEETPISSAGTSSVGTIYVGANNASTFIAVCKWYSVKIYKSGTLDCDFVPCVSPDGVSGFYDIVRDEFYTRSVGSTTLTPGPAV